MKTRYFQTCVIIASWAFTLSAIGQSSDPFAARRQIVMEEMGEGCAVLSGSATNLFFLTGLKERDATLVLAPQGEVKEVLFCTSGEWDYAKNHASAKVHQAAEKDNLLSTYVPEDQPTKNITSIINKMRVIKDAYELQMLKNACQVTAEGLCEAYRAAKPGVTEKDLAKVMTDGFIKRGSPGTSFLQCASGPNSVNVHFGATERKMEAGDMIVFDVGAWWEGYTSDISRAIPVSGRFTKEQKEIYQVVLNSQKASIKRMLPGVSFSEVRQVGQDTLIDGLVELGLVLDKESSWQRSMYFAHGYQHHIGLAIHDVNGAREYQPGMVVTMEPGLYFPAGKLERQPRGASDEEYQAFLAKVGPVYKKYVNMGVRIEDDVLITKTGNEVITAGVPKEIADIEKMMNEKE